MGQQKKLYDLRLERFFSREWTHVSQIEWLKLLFALKLAGYDWSSIEDIAKICAFMERKGWIESNSEHCIRLVS